MDDQDGDKDIPGRLVNQYEATLVLELVQEPMNVDELYDEIEKIKERFPILTDFDILRKFFNSNGDEGNKELCPTALVDPWVDWLLELENAAQTYHVLPYPGALLDQPAWVLEAFRTIREVKNVFERRRTKSLISKVKDGKNAA